VTYLIRTSKNLNPATIKGFEVGFQQFFTFLPAPFDGFGLQANYTYVDSSTPTTVSGIGAPVDAPLTNLSKTSYNAIAMYEKGPFSARVAYNYRSEFVTGFAYYVNTGLLNQEMRGYADLDASINYNITKNIQVAVQGVNLTNALQVPVLRLEAVPVEHLSRWTAADGERDVAVLSGDVPVDSNGPGQVCRSSAGDRPGAGVVRSASDAQTSSSRS
jgi:iron complex outermembrane receptor protein